MDPSSPFERVLVLGLWWRQDSPVGLFELVLVLLAAVAVLALAARKLEILYPILLVIGGLVLSLVPGLPRLRLEALDAERRTILQLRNQRVINDEALRRIQRDIDLAETRLRQDETGV
jgi:hypothetical protein